MINNYYLQHVTSGDVFAVQLSDDEVVSACGPLDESDVTAENLKTWNFDSDPELVEDLDAMFDWLVLHEVK